MIIRNLQCEKYGDHVVCVAHALSAPADKAPPRGDEADYPVPCRAEWPCVWALEVNLLKVNHKVDTVTETNV